MRKLIIKILILPLLGVIICSCDKRSIETNAIYGKWIPVDGNSTSKCIYLLEDGTAEFFDCNWKDIGQYSGIHLMPNTCIWSMESEYENPGGILFMHGKAIHFVYEKNGFCFATGWFRWNDDRLTLLFCGGDPDDYELIEYIKSPPMLTKASSQKLAVQLNNSTGTFNMHSQTFIITNLSNTMINIFCARSSYDDIVISFQPCTLAPGKDTSVNVSFIETKLSGIFRRTIYLETDAPGQEFLKVNVSGIAVPSANVHPEFK